MFEKIKKFFGGSTPEKKKSPPSGNPHRSPVKEKQGYHGNNFQKSSSSYQKPVSKRLPKKPM